MSIYALLSPGGSPGVTTASLALALGWPGQVILAECDPSGGDILAGLFAGHLTGDRGLLPLALEAGRGTEAAAAELWQQLVALDDENAKYLLAGVSDPRQAAGLEPAWPALAAALAALPADVIADCGRLDAAGSLRPVLSAASLVVLVVRPSLRQVSRAMPRLELLAQLTARAGARLATAAPPVVALLVGSGGYSAREVSGALGVPVAGTLPLDHKSAGVLSDGAGSRRALPGRPLARAAAEAGRALRAAAAAPAAQVPVAGPAHWDDAPATAGAQDSGGWS